MCRNNMCLHTHTNTNTHAHAHAHPHTHTHVTHTTSDLLACLIPLQRLITLTTHHSENVRRVPICLVCALSSTYTLKQLTHARKTHHATSERVWNVDLLDTHTTAMLAWNNPRSHSFLNNTRFQPPSNRRLSPWPGCLPDVLCLVTPLKSNDSRLRR